MKTQNPWMGRFRGSAGNMTGSKVYDKNVLRAKAFEVSNPNTAAQQVQRDFFKQLAATCATFSEEELRFLFPQKPKSMSRRNAISKQLASDAVMIEGEKVLDFASIDTLGNAPTMDFGTTECVNDGTNITVTLDPIVSGNVTYGSYVFVATLVNVTKGEITMPLVGVTVETGILEIPLPAGWENADEVNAIPLITDSTELEAGGGFSTLKVAKRPVRGATMPPAPSQSVTVYFNGNSIGSMIGVNLQGTIGQGGIPTNLTDVTAMNDVVSEGRWVDDGNGGWVATQEIVIDPADQIELNVELAGEVFESLSVNAVIINI